MNLKDHIFPDVILIDKLQISIGSLFFQAFQLKKQVFKT